MLDASDLARLSAFHRELAEFYDRLAKKAQQKKRRVRRAPESVTRQRDVIGKIQRDLAKQGIKS